MTISITPSNVARPRPDWLRVEPVPDPVVATFLAVDVVSLKNVTAVAWCASDEEGVDVRGRCVVLAADDLATIDKLVCGIVLRAIDEAVAQDNLLRLSVGYAPLRRALSEYVCQIENLGWLDPNVSRGAGSTATTYATQRAQRAVFAHAAPDYIATDASKQTGRQGAGLGALVDDRLVIAGFAPGCRSVLEGEIEAIALGLAQAKTKHVVVHTDSQQAVRILRAAHGAEADPMLTFRGSGHRVSTAVDRVRSASKGHVVQFEWVPGHADHTGNIIADRLAVLARRSADAGSAPGTVKDVMRNILDQELGSSLGVTLVTKGIRHAVDVFDTLPVRPAIEADM